jgi:hypothetical protein
MLKLSDLTFLASVARNMGVPIIPGILDSFATLNITTVKDLEKLVNINFWLMTTTTKLNISIPNDILEVFTNLNIT